ncbi:SAM-dependent methyltransferase [Curvibacter sp. CHRR-16]|uniref:class I SAM-dependent methyltransferase n=1 Tax=Curvibacter sp. CHRR-16 TaxID=2835872 RepID=UPI001BD99E90|nr:SAM-dependent methyltransferase [Curvibacter sp. CHRR-16]MBT0570936.1 SAM-dependent methyltransferase [Curvibacter sp. CHRR-16]
MSNADVSAASLVRIIADAIAQQGGWVGFDHFMAQALYAPGLGYYANNLPKFGAMPGGLRTDGQLRGVGSDFVTAPELSPLFGLTLARQVAQILQATGTDEVWEFGAGTGALAAQVLSALADMGVAVRRYTIVDLSGSLQQRQRETLARFGAQVHWATELPAKLRGVVLGNEVLDAMPVQLLARVQGQWYERGVVLAPSDAAAPAFAWADRPTELRPPLDVDGAHDYLTEIHPQGEAFVRTLADKLELGAALLLDYGFPEAEYYHPQRHMGTVMCHQGHRSDPDPLTGVGDKDITAHVNFTGVALAAQDAGLDVLGYTNQGHFLFNCGLAPLMEAVDLPRRAAAAKLVNEHEMGEIFKVLAIGRGVPQPLLGFAMGDRTHRL